MNYEFEPNNPALAYIFPKTDFKQFADSKTNGPDRHLMNADDLAESITEATQSRLVLVRFRGGRRMSQVSYQSLAASLWDCDSGRSCCPQGTGSDDKFPQTVAAFSCISFGYSQSS